MQKKFILALSLAAANVVSAGTQSDLLNIAPRTTTVTEPTVEELKNQTGWWYGKKAGFFAGIIAGGMDADYKAAQAPLPAPVDEDPELMKMVPFGYGLNNVYIAANPPKAEKSFFDKLAGKGVAFLLNNVSLATNVQIPSAHDKVFDICLPNGIQQGLARLGFPNGRPVLPTELAENVGDAVGGSALKGSFAYRIKSCSSSSFPKGFNSFRALAGVGAYEAGMYVIDLLNYNDYQTKPGLDKIGGQAILAYNSSRGYMEALAIQSDREGPWVYRPRMNNAKWGNAQRRMMAAMLTDTTFNRHLGEAHLAVSATISSITYLLPKDHPMRSMLHIHTIGAIPVNKYNVPTLLAGEGAFFGRISSYNVATIQKIMNDSLSKFSFERINPIIDLEARSMNDGSVPYPYADSAKKIWGMTEAYVQEYIGHYYPTDDAIVRDEALQDWYQKVNQYVPNGGLSSQLTRESLVGTVARFIYSNAFDHFCSGIDIINYGSFPNIVPSQVASDGSRPTLDVVSYTFYLLAATQPTNRLPMNADSFAQFGLDSEGKNITRRFELKMYQFQEEDSLANSPMFMSSSQGLQASVYS